MKIKSLISTAALIAGMSSVAPVATAGDYSASVDVVTSYFFRGTTLANEAVQVGVEGAWGDFYAGAWNSAAFGEESNNAFDELDLYAGYGFGVSDTISADVGATLYHYPELGDLFDIGDVVNDPEASTLEIFGGLNFDTAFAPSLYAYYDTSLEYFTLEAGAGYSMAAGEKTSFDLSGTVGLTDGDDDVLADGGWTYYSLAASLGYAVSDDTSAYVGLNFGGSSEELFLDYDDGSTDKSGVWLSTGFSTGF